MYVQLKMERNQPFNEFLYFEMYAKKNKNLL